MKAIKFQQDVLALVAKGKETVLVGCEDDDYVLLATPYILMRIPDTDFWLDYNRILDDKKEIKLSQIWHESETDITEPTGVLMEVPTNGKPERVVEFRSENGTKTYIPEKQLKYFDNPIYRTMGEFKLMGIYENGKLVGVVVGVTVNRRDK